jgi:hypothetical protein
VTSNRLAINDLALLRLSINIRSPIQKFNDVRSQTRRQARTTFPACMAPKVVLQVILRVNLRAEYRMVALTERVYSDWTRRARTSYDDPEVADDWCAGRTPGHKLINECSNFVRRECYILRGSRANIARCSLGSLGGVLSPPTPASSAFRFPDPEVDCDCSMISSIMHVQDRRCGHCWLGFMVRTWMMVKERQENPIAIVEQIAIRNNLNRPMPIFAKW